MTLEFRCCVLLIVMLGYAFSGLCVFDGIHTDDIDMTGKDNEEVVASNRETRSLSRLASMYWKGFRATSAVLKGAKKVFKSKAYTQYIKTGGRTQAENDFYSVSPSNLIDHGVFKSGMIGDRRITVSLGNEPSVSIYTPKRIPSKTVDQVVDNVVYVL